MTDIAASPGTALVPHAGDVALPRKPAKALAEPRRSWSWRREKVVKEGALGALLKPIGIMEIVRTGKVAISRGTATFTTDGKDKDHAA